MSDNDSVKSKSERKRRRESVRRNEIKVSVIRENACKKVCVGITERERIEKEITEIDIV